MRPVPPPVHAAAGGGRLARMAPARRPAAGSTAVERSAGPTPNRNTDSAVMARVKSSTAESGPAPNGVPDSSGRKRITTRCPQAASTDAERAACRDQEDALGQRLADQACARGAKREAHRHLFLAGRSACQQQVGHVGAGGQQDQSDGQPSARSAGGRIPRATSRCPRDASRTSRRCSKRSLAEGGVVESGP